MANSGVPQGTHLGAFFVYIGFLFKCQTKKISEKINPSSNDYIMSEHILLALYNCIVRRNLNIHYRFAYPSLKR